MCGIVGWVGVQNFRDPERTLQSAIRVMHHRGPDGSGIFRSEIKGGYDLALGHCRLAILDVSGGAQPMQSHDARYVISFNGEIYNYVELRERLVERGCRFLSNSDTEVILEAYRTWGIDCLSQFRGMFSFALFDRATESLLLARDPFGKKPLMYAAAPGGFIFASEISPLFCLGAERRLRAESLSDYISLRYVRGPNTMFEGIHKLEPGSWLRWERGAATTGRYFVPPASFMQPEAMTSAQALECVGSVLEDAVRLRMRSDVPFGAYLSGGLDSSLVVALMRRHTGEQVRTFSVGFDDRRYSELDHANRVAKLLDTRNTSLTVSAEKFLDFWPSATLHRGAPVSEASDIPILMLSQMAGKSVKVILTGEGADEFFGGYPKYKAEGWVSNYQRMIPSRLHTTLLDPVLRALPLARDRARILGDMLAERDARARGQLWFGSASRALTRELTGQDLSDVGSLPFPFTGSSGLRRLQSFDHAYWLPDNLLERGDRMLMAGSVEGRMPFMDVELARVAARLPDGFLLGHPKGKAILRTFAEGLIDVATITRPKVGFKVPVGDWLRSGMRATMLDLLSSGTSRTRGLLNSACVDQLVSSHLAERANNEKILWTLCNLEIFLREFDLDLRVQQAAPRAA